MIRIMEAQTTVEHLNPDAESLRDRPDADWIGNNAAFVCPVCKHVYIVTGAGEGRGGREMDLQPNPNMRVCPKCGKSTAYIPPGGRKNALKGKAERARIEWRVS